MWKPAQVVSANFLKRIGESGSRFHSDYQAYQKGDISKTELIARLPHVAMVGDSACMGVHISSVWGTFWRGHKRRGNNWFFDTEPTPPAIQSVSKRLEELTSFVAIECAGIGALVDQEGERRNFFRTILRTRNFSGQIDGLLKMKRFPDLVLISIGHNNVDWAWYCVPADLDRPDNRLRQLSHCFRENFARQLRRLIDQGRRQSRRIAVVVYGLVNFDSYFRGREIAELLRVNDAARYPHLESTYKYFRSFRPAYRSNLIRLARMVNEELRGDGNSTGSGAHRHVDGGAAIFGRASHSRFKSRGTTPPDRWLARLGRRPQRSRRSRVSRSRTKSKISRVQVSGIGTAPVVAAIC